MSFFNETRRVAKWIAYPILGLFLIGLLAAIIAA